MQSNLQITKTQEYTAVWEYVTLYYMAEEKCQLHYGEWTIKNHHQIWKVIEKYEDLDEKIHLYHLWPWTRIVYSLWWDLLVITYAV